jgi:hypothetical protein
MNKEIKSNEVNQSDFTSEAKDWKDIVYEKSKDDKPQGFFAEMENQVAEIEYVVEEENPKPVFIQPKIVPPRVLLEVLIYGDYPSGTDPKLSTVFQKALNLQQQIDLLRGKDKFRVRILWKGIEVKEPMNYDQSQECQEWLIENSSCKYYQLIAYRFDAPIEFPANYIKDKLNEIKDFEKAMSKFKASQIQLKRK